jgi:predicted ArsR family transcriptional regulator
MEWLRIEKPVPATIRPDGGLQRERPASIIFQVHTLIISRLLNMSRERLENFVRPAADRFLVFLKTRGPQTAASLGKAAGVTAEAARQQLVRLASDGLVVAAAKPRGVGRPTQMWGLTEAGNARFPDGHAELTAQLIGTIRTQLGEDVLDRLIALRTAESKANYAAALEGTTGLGERVARLAEARTQEGYMAESRAEGDGYLLVENHCPICVAATACQGFCRAELDTFRAVLGPEASVERTEHIIQGDRRCAYRVSLQIVPELRKRPDAGAARAGKARPKRRQ